MQVIYYRPFSRGWFLIPSRRKLQPSQMKNHSRMMNVSLRLVCLLHWMWMNSLSGNKRHKYFMANSWGGIMKVCFCEGHIIIRCILGSDAGSLRTSWCSVWRAILIYLFIDQLLDLITLNLMEWKEAITSLRLIFIRLVRWWHLIIIGAKEEVRWRGGWEVVVENQRKRKSVLTSWRSYVTYVM